MKLDKLRELFTEPEAMEVPEPELPDGVKWKDVELPPGFTVPDSGGLFPGPAPDIEIAISSHDLKWFPPHSRIEVVKKRVENALARQGWPPSTQVHVGDISFRDSKTLDIQVLGPDGATTMLDGSYEVFSDQVKIRIPPFAHPHVFGIDPGSGPDRTAVATAVKGHGPGVFIVDEMESTHPRGLEALKYLLWCEDWHVRHAKAIKVAITDELNAHPEYAWPKHGFMVTGELLPVTGLMKGEYKVAIESTDGPSLRRVKDFVHITWRETAGTLSVDIPRFPVDSRVGYVVVEKGDAADHVVEWLGAKNKDDAYERLAILCNEVAARTPFEHRDVVDSISHMVQLRLPICLEAIKRSKDHWEDSVQALADMVCRLRMAGITTLEALQRLKDASDKLGKTLEGAAAAAKATMKALDEFAKSMRPVAAGIAEAVERAVKETMPHYVDAESDVDVADDELIARVKAKVESSVPLLTIDIVPPGPDPPEGCEHEWIVKDPITASLPKYMVCSKCGVRKCDIRAIPEADACPRCGSEDYHAGLGGCEKCFMDSKPYKYTLRPLWRRRAEKLLGYELSSKKAEELGIDLDALIKAPPSAARAEEIVSKLEEECYKRGIVWDVDEYSRACHRVTGAPEPSPTEIPEAPTPPPLVRAAIDGDHDRSGRCTGYGPEDFGGSDYLEPYVSCQGCGRALYERDRRYQVKDREGTYCDGCLPAISS